MCIYLNLCLMRACFHASIVWNHLIAIQRIRSIPLCYRAEKHAHTKTETYFTIRSLCQRNICTMLDARCFYHWLKHCKRMPKVQTLCAHTFRIIRNEILNDCFIRQLIHLKRFEPLRKEKRFFFLPQNICWLRIFPTKNFKWTSLGRYYRIGLNKA